MKKPYIYMSAIGMLMLAAVSCGPSRYMIDVEMRHKSKAGVDFTGKNVTVVYPKTQEYPLGTYVESLADGLAWNLKDQYQQTLDSVAVFALNDSGEKYASRDSLISLLMKTGSDVVLLLDKVDYGAISLRCYDAMNQDDRMLSQCSNQQVNQGSTQTQTKQNQAEGKAPPD